MMGESQPNRSADFTPRQCPPKLTVEGWTDRIGDATTPRTGDGRGSSNDIDNGGFLSSIFHRMDKLDKMSGQQVI